MQISSNTKRVIERLKRYQRELDTRMNLIIEQLSKEGFEIAKYAFDNAIYDGENDVVVSVEWQSETECTILAKGAHVLFIEFGSGTHYPEHPLANELGMKHGRYGHGRGYEKKYPKGWVYEGPMGVNPTEYAHHPSRTTKHKDGSISKSEADPTKVRTLGNPPAMAMYSASVAMRQRVEQIAKEVFE